MAKNHLHLNGLYFSGYMLYPVKSVPIGLKGLFAGKYNKKIAKPQLKPGFNVSRHLKNQQTSNKDDQAKLELIGKFYFIRHL